MKSPRMKSPLRRIVAGLSLALAGFAGSAHAVVHPFTKVHIDGLQEVPPFAGDGSATMDCVFNETTGAITWYVDYELDTDSTTMTDAHFHGPAPVGVNAGVRIGLNDGTFPKGRVGIFRGTSTVALAQRTEVLNELWYINIHSNIRPGGELRAQLVPGPVTHYFSANPITGAQETPPITTNGTGTIDAAYDAATKTLTFGARWSNLSTTVTGIHFHVAPPGTPGGITVDFATLGSFPTTTTGAFASSVVLSDAQETQLLDGNFYINIHTTMHGGGEIRGQLNPIAVPVVVLGDINDDGVINVADVTELANLLAAETPPDAAIGDINDDGEVDELDVEALAEMIVDSD